MNSDKWMSKSQIIVTSRYLKSGSKKAESKRKNYTKYIAHLGAGVFRGDPFRDLHQPVQRDLIPILDRIIVLLLHDDIQLLLRIIDQRRQTLLIPDAERIAKLLVDLPAHGAGTVFQDMVKLLILSVDIRHKMFRALGQIQNRL